MKTDIYPVVRSEDPAYNFGHITSYAACSDCGAAVGVGIPYLEGDDIDALIELWEPWVKTITNLKCKDCKTKAEAA